MSDIFLSYASEDVERASGLALALSRYGWSVWWDRSILPGKVFDTVIETELSAAKCVIVLWSMHSVESRWVRAEAGEAMDKGRLIPALLDEAVIPLVFRQVQAASLSGWDGDPAHSGFQRLVKAISAVVPPRPASASGETAGVSAQGAAAAEARADTLTPNAGWWAFIALCALVVAGGAFYFLREDAPAGISSVSREPQTKPSTGLMVEAPVSRIEPFKQQSAGLKQADAETKTARTTPSRPSAATESAKAVTSEPTATPTKPEPSKPASPAAKPTAPVIVKPVEDSRVAKPVQSPETLAKAEPAETVTKPATPLTVLAVAWAMPNDNGVASTARIKDYSARLSRMMTTVVDKTMNSPVRFEYHYPDQQEHYRLLKNDASIGTLCGTKRADLVIAGFVEGAKYVSSGYGYALTRNPVFTLFDCKTRKKITQTYQVAEKFGDRFPFEQSTTAVFRTFVQQDAALAKR